MFYAHTISPVAIAVLTSLGMVFFIGKLYLPAAWIALFGYLTIGAVIPLWNGKKGTEEGIKLRNSFGELNSFLLDSLRGLDETIAYGRGEERMEEMDRRSRELGRLQSRQNRREAVQNAVSDLTILMFSFGMLFFMLWNLERGNVGFDRMLLVVLAMMGSFGPVVALSNLSNNLNQTLASAQRVFSLLEEEPQTKDVKGEETAAFHGASARRVNFSYAEEQILKEYSIDFPKGKTVGIHGASGSGKSTLLKLLMRFWDVDEGCVKISERDIRRINTGDLRAMEACVTQETCLFHDSIANNIALGRRNASRVEIMEAARKASVHDFIMSLPKGYDTEVGELGDTLSGGERQRIGMP